MIDPLAAAVDEIAKPRVLGGDRIGAEVIARIMRRVDVQTRADTSQQRLDDMLCETLYREQQRLSHADGEPRAALDRAFIKDVRHEFAHTLNGERRALVERVVRHYAREISGHFDPRVYKLATSVVPSALGALLHGMKPSRHLFDVDERVLLHGEVAALQRAVQTGTVVLVPTHVSNLDSLVLGYVIYRLGLPPFAYGAGLNLFSHAVLGFFMRHLGTFTVDRKKTDPLYLDCVKEYATVLLEHGQHLLFFPGGTRSRSGAIESHLKLGFLSRVITAFVNRQARDRHAKPLFVVPCTLSYPLVLEAATLIDEYLAKEGGPHFVDVRDEFEHPARWLGFLSGLAELDVPIHVRFGAPLDPLGNAIDENGVSHDERGRVLDPVRYLLDGGAVAHDDARDAEYTHALAGKLVASYHRASVALPSSVLAFALMTCLRRRFPRLDLFRFLRVLGPSSVVTLAELEPAIDAVLRALSQLVAAGRIVLGPELAARGRAAVLDQGVATLGAYHRPPIVTRLPEALRVDEPTLLVYYRNRLDGFGLPDGSAP